MVKSLYKVQMLDVQTSNFDKQTKENELRKLERKLMNIEL